MKRFYSFIILLVACLVTVNLHADELTVNDGTTTISQVPLYGLYADYGTRSQYVVPATELGSMAGKSIMAIKYYSSSASQNLTGTWDVYLKEVTETSASATYISREGATKVWTGSPSVANNELNIEFTADFSYNGGNLMVEFVETSVGNCPNFYWYGTSGSSVYNYGGSSDHTTFQTAPTGSFVQYVPKTTFVYGVPSSCKKPSGLTISDITTSSAQISWTENSEVTAWQICLNDNEEKLIDATATPLALSTLTANTAYSVKVRANCGDEKSEWSSTIYFRTNCDVSSMPFSENFNSLTADGQIPFCWSNDEGTTTNANNKWSYHASGHEGKCLRFNSYSNSYNTNVIATPTIHLDKAAMLSFWCKNPAGGAFEVKISEAGSEERTTLLTGLTSISSWTEKEVDLSAYINKDIVIYFCGTSNNGYGDAYLYLDDVKVFEKPTCPMPISLVDAEVKNHSVKLSWTEKGEAEAWQIAYKTDAEENFAIADANANPFVLTGLTADKAYTVKVRANCGAVDGTSEWSDPINFTTRVACEPLASITISDVQRRSFVVTFNPATGFDLGENELVYSTSALDNEALEAATGKIIVNTQNYTVSGLERETKYYVYARVNCGDQDGKSAWVSAEVTTKGLSGCDDIALGTGTSTSTNLPTHSNFDFSLSEQIYTAAEIGETGNISSIAFYNSGSARTRTLDVYMLHTDKAEFTSATDWVKVAESDKVFSGNVTFTASAWVKIELTTPFAYNGTDNILLVVDDNTDSYSSGLSCRTYTTTNYESLSKYQDNTDIDPTTSVSVSGTKLQSKNQIKFTFCYELDPCPAVSNMAHELVEEGTTKANVSWNISGADYLSGFDVILSESEITDFTGKEPTHANIQDSYINFTTLTAATHYYVYVRAICKAAGKDEGNSDWAGIDFTTNADCPAVLNLEAELTAANAVQVSWNKAFEEQEPHFQYVLSKTALDAAALEAATPVAVDGATSKDIEELDFEQEYHIYVASKCGDAHSDYVHASFTTLASCQAVENLAATRTEHNRVEISWTSAEFATETQWEVSVDGDDSKTQIVSERKAIVFGLEPDHDYVIKVKAKCSGSESSAAVSLPIHTADQPGDCKQVGNGTSSSYYAPLNVYYKNSWVQVIYPAAEIGQSGKIESIAYNCASIESTKSLAGEINIYMAHTDKAVHSTSSDWIAAKDLILVYHKDAFEKPTATGWWDIALQTPFEYNGTDNIAVVVAIKGLTDYSNNLTFKYTSATDAILYRTSDTDTSYGVHPGSNTGSKSSYRANIQFCFEAKDCPDVTALAVSDITKNSAIVSWEPMGGESAWNVLISTSDNVTDFSGTEEVTSLSKHFEGLLADQDYYVYIQPDCSGADFSKISFTTLPSCKAMTSAAVVSESITKNSASVSWTDPNAEPAGNYTIAYGMYDAFDLEKEATYQTVNAEATPANITGLTPDTKYKFAVMANCGENGPSRWSNVADFTTAIACYTPSTPTVDAESITTNSATIAWVDEHDAAGYTVAYGLSSTFDIDDATTYETINVTEKTVVLENLLASSTYKVRVKADCGEDGQSKDWSTARTFSTACGAVALPFTEDFEGDINCWTKEDCESSTGLNSSAARNGSYGFGFHWSTTPPQYLISPELVASDKPVKVEFYYMNSSYEETFHVGYSITTNEVNAFTWSDEIVVNANTDWTLYSDTKPANVKYVAIKCTSDDQYYLYIDDFSVAVSGSDQTAVDNTVNAAQIIKRIENGLLLIEVNGVIYNAQGEVVTK